MAEKFGQARTRPDGHWIQTTPLLNVAGLTHHKSDGLAFAQAVRAAERDGLSYGLDLQPEPENAYDPKAIKVIGKAQVKRIFGGSERRRWHIGYVPREVAAEVTEELIAQGHTYCAELYGIYIGAEDYLDIEFFVLVPRNSPATLRQARRMAATANGPEPALTDEQTQFLRDGLLGLYRNTRLAQAEALKRMGDVGGALDMYLRVAWLDEYGPSNAGMLGTPAKPGLSVFKPSDVSTAPGILKAIAQGANTLRASLDSVAARFGDCGMREKRALANLAPSGAPRDNWPRIETAIRDQMANGTRWRIARPVPLD